MYKIVLIEDNPEIRDTTAQLLMRRGYEVHSASDGQEGLECIQKTSPDIIVCDIMMPVMDGLELLNIIRTTNQLKHIPFLFLTARVDMDDKLKGLGLGANDYITKPFEIKELALRIGNTIKQRHQSIQHALSSPDKEEVLSKHERFVLALNKAIEQEIKNTKLSMKDIAKILGISDSSLQKKLKHATNKSVSQYVREYRLERAKDLLSSNFGSLKEISAEVGFRNASYLSTTFKEFYGKTPTEYFF